MKVINLELQACIITEVRQAAAALGADARKTAGVPVGELYEYLDSLGAPPNLLGVLSSWGEELSEYDVLELLKAWNAGKPLELRTIH